MNDLYVKCSCHSEGFYINYEEEGLYYVSFFSLGYRSGELSFWNKLRWVWHILSKGKPFDDQVVLNKEEAKKIADFIRTNNISK